MAQGRGRGRYAHCKILFLSALNGQQQPIYQPLISLQGCTQRRWKVGLLQHTQQTQQQQPIHEHLISLQGCTQRRWMVGVLKPEPQDFDLELEGGWTSPEPPSETECLIALIMHRVFHGPGAARS